MRSSFLTKSKRAQVTLFVILALIIVGGIITYFLVRNVYVSEVPVNMKPVYDSYISCLENSARQGVSLLGTQGGFIELPTFVPGSQYMPFSSQLDFFGQPIPYWLYVSGNNILSEQVPTKVSMQNELNKFVKERLMDCDFSEFERQGFYIEISDGDISSSIQDLKVDLIANNQIAISFDNKTVVVNQHKFSLDSKLGKFFGLALNTYNYEKQNMFLEKYAVDVLRLYAPVDGVELTCSPKIFNEQTIRTDLTGALEENIAMLKLKGSYYNLNSDLNKYFVTDTKQNVDENVNIIYSSNWPTRVEIYGDLVNTPVGLQQGLGILGFCYVPYHLVYDVDFPVLIQFYDNSEIFQFPIAVIINKNQERNALEGQAGESVESEVCKYQNQPVQVYTYDSELNPVKAKIKFSCLTSECNIGETEIEGENAIFEGNFPQCVNGFILASADGYAESKYQISTNEESVANIIMNRLYNISLDVKSGGREIDYALVTFNSPDFIKTVVYPDMNSVELIEGMYNVSVFVYKNSSVKIPAVSDRKCVQVPKSGIMGFFGSTEEKCYDITIPEQEFGFVVSGGGTNEGEYFTEDMLKRENMLIDTESFKSPESISDIQENYALASNTNLNIQI